MGKNGKFRDRRGHTLFIDARGMGTMRDRTHRELTEEDIGKIAGTYHAWRGEPDAAEYEDVPGFCAEATTEEIKEHNCVVTPGRYVGAPDVEHDGEPFEQKMPKLVAELHEQFHESDGLSATIRKNLLTMGYDN